jgi:dUTP pyrophosphatase
MKRKFEKIRGFEIVSNNFRKFPNQEINLPKRATEYSAGYDLFSNEFVIIHPHTKYLFWTDIKAYMQPDEVLNIYVRSSIGIKKDLMLANGIGIIDSDYYSNENNDGNIGICLFNYSDKEVNIDKNERIAQGIFTKYLTVTDDIVSIKRSGGIGHSTIISY